MAEAKFIGGQQICDTRTRGNSKGISDRVMFVKKGLRLSSSNTFTPGSKWPNSGSAVSDSKYGRFGRMSGRESGVSLCLENASYAMSIGAYTTDSGAVVNASPRFTIEPFEKFVLPSDWTYIALDFKRKDGEDITSEDGEAIRASVFIYDVADTESYYTKNLIGNIPNVPYPVTLPPHTIITVATSDGSEFDGTIQLQALDEDKIQVSYWTLSNGLTSRVITTPGDRRTTYYVRINKPSKVPLMLTYGIAPANNAYAPYFPPNKALADRQYLGAEQRKIKVCAWNVGNFAYGEAAEGIGTNQMYDQFISTFKKCNADIYLFSEWDYYWNKAQSVKSKDKIGALKPYWSQFDNSTIARYVDQQVATEFPILYQNREFYSDGESRSFIHIVHNIYGKPVHFFSTHFPWSSSSLRDSDIQMLQDYITAVGAEYVVIGGDFNGGLSTESDDRPTTSAEMYALLAHDKKVWTDAGYVTAQGTFWGPTSTNLYINTGKTELSEIYPVRAYDNIVVSPNIAITNVYTEETEASDHLPILAELILLD